MKKMLLLIDGSSLLSTHYHGSLPRELQGVRDPEARQALYSKILQTSSGQYTNAMYGMLKAILKIIEEQKPSHLAVCWDVTRNTFRRNLATSYKGTRKATDDPLKEQFVNMQDLFQAIGVAQMMSHPEADQEAIFEADDYLGSLAKKFEGTIPTFILTKDNDALQLVSESTRLWLVTSKADELRQLYYPDLAGSLPSGVIELTPDLVKAYKGVYPKECIDLKALEGDSGDNIPGVKGVGPKAAIPLIQEYGNIETLYDMIEDLDAKQEKELKEFWKTELGIARAPLANLLKASTEEEVLGKESAFLSKALGTIKCDIPISETLADFEVNILRDKLVEQCEKYEFRSLLNPKKENTSRPASLIKKPVQKTKPAPQKNELDDFINGKFEEEQITLF